MVQIRQKDHHPTRHTNSTPPMTTNTNTNTNNTNTNTNKVQELETLVRLFNQQLLLTSTKNTGIEQALLKLRQASKKIVNEMTSTETEHLFNNIFTKSVLPNIFQMVQGAVGVYQQFVNMNAKQIFQEAAMGAEPDEELFSLIDEIASKLDNSDMYVVAPSGLTNTSQDIMDAFINVNNSLTQLYRNIYENKTVIYDEDCENYLKFTEDFEILLRLLKIDIPRVQRVGGHKKKKQTYIFKDTDICKK
jgi:hypothetical protein